MRDGQMEAKGRKTNWKAEWRGDGEWDGNMRIAIDECEEKQEKKALLEEQVETSMPIKKK